MLEKGCDDAVKKSFVTLQSIMVTYQDLKTVFDFFKKLAAEQIALNEEQNPMKTDQKQEKMRDILDFNSTYLPQHLVKFLVDDAAKNDADSILEKKISSQ